MTEKLAIEPLNVTFVAPVKCLPLMITAVFEIPTVGEKSEIYGPGPMTVNALGLVAVPPGPVTVISPLVAPAGTFRKICVPVESGVKTALIPLNLTEVAPVK